LKRASTRYWANVSAVSLLEISRQKDSTGRVISLYGKPDSRSPSTKADQRLELLYYAFDWAGPDVPQVMEALCTVEHDGKPGRVVEIALAASSL
jgi:hypothetical protein